MTFSNSVRSKYTSFRSIHQLRMGMLTSGNCRAAGADQSPPTDSPGYPLLDSDKSEIIVGPLALPAGYPVPPNQRFPAEFECPLCFRLKRFSKPSDWSKHVQEDIQPFVCTFQECSEPRSFKRRADWVRHENERHRQLEWWTCNMKDCSHKCFRKDNFVQHLVREHKMPEPKLRSLDIHKLPEPKAKSQDVQSSTTPNADDQIWKLVDACRHETAKSPKDEPCKFCGNYCNNWKKLTVHVAKHMESIAMPTWSKVASYKHTPKATARRVSSVGRCHVRVYNV